MKKLCKLYIEPDTNPTFHWFPVRYGMYSLCFQPCINYTQTLHGDPTQNPTKNLHRSLHRTLHTNPTFCFLNMNNANGASVLLVAVCHNSQSASLLSDSGLVMYFSTLPAPSSSAPCILAILTHLWGWSQNVHFDTPSSKFSTPKALFRF